MQKPDKCLTRRQHNSSKEDGTGGSVGGALWLVLDAATAARHRLSARRNAKAPPCDCFRRQPGGVGIIRLEARRLGLNATKDAVARQVASARPLIARGLMAPVAETRDAAQRYRPASQELRMASVPGVTSAVCAVRARRAPYCPTPQQPRYTRREPRQSARLHRFVRRCGAE